MPTRDRNVIDRALARRDAVDHAKRSEVDRVIEVTTAHQNVK